MTEAELRQEALREANVAHSRDTDRDEVVKTAHEFYKFLACSKGRLDLADELRKCVSDENMNGSDPDTFRYVETEVRPFVLIAARFLDGDYDGDIGLERLELTVDNVTSER